MYSSDKFLIFSYKLLYKQFIIIHYQFQIYHTGQKIFQSQQILIIHHILIFHNKILHLFVKEIYKLSLHLFKFLCQSNNNNKNKKNKQLKSCVNKYEDNILAGIEQCDEGNQTDKDECNSKCEIEKDIICIDGVCILPPKKQVTFTYFNSTTANGFDLNFEDIKIECLCVKLQIWIEQFQSYEFQYNIKIKENYTSISQGCQIQFKFFKTILGSSLIHLIVLLKETVIRGGFKHIPISKQLAEKFQLFILKIKDQLEK
ncbi:unnamed protein product [Paramecium pentaurelia]|uniref:Uncharacterized protein n=1 Tax=Paramecium pentaurelia TaxID=43138 RepID=A0A8S1YN97_9CILI|nr:unnamed protein product [Paramecium pentaurelia]